MHNLPVNLAEKKTELLAFWQSDFHSIYISENTAEVLKSAGTYYFKNTQIIA